MTENWMNEKNYSDNCNYTGSPLKCSNIVLTKEEVHWRSINKINLLLIKVVNMTREKKDANIYFYICPGENK